MTWEHDLRRMGFCRNEIQTIVDIAAQLVIDPSLLGQFIMQERFKVQIKRIDELGVKLRWLTGEDEPE